MAIDHCDRTEPHGPHRTQHGGFGIKDCPGVPLPSSTAFDRAFAPPPPLERIGVPGELLELETSGLTADQEIRVEALASATRFHSSHGGWESTRARVLADADWFAAYIRDGSTT